MDTQSIASILAGVLFMVAFVPYILAIRRGETKPAKASWLIWATLDTITLAGMHFEGSLNGQIVGAVLGAWTVVVFAFKYGTSGWTKLDKFCFVGAVLGIALWQTFSSPVLGMATSLSVVFIGSIPTFVSAWNDPSKEDKTAWTIFWVSCILATFAIPKWDVSNASQPLTFLAIESVMMFLLFIRPRFR